MAYNDLTEFPRGIETGDFAASLVVFPAGAKVKIDSIVLSNATGAIELAFRHGDNSAEIMTVDMPAAGTVVIPAFTVLNGLRITIAGSSRTFSIFYFKA